MAGFGPARARVAVAERVRVVRLRTALTRGWLEQELAAERRPAARAALRGSFHLRRYAPLYAFVTVWVLMAAILPSVNHGSFASGRLGLGTGRRQTVGAHGSDGIGAAGMTTDTFGASTDAGGGVGGTSPGTLGSSGGAGGTSPGTLGSSIGPTGTTVDPPQVGAGVTRGGYPCKAGVRQIPSSLYAPPCVAKFTGANGGATYRGVTADTIKIAVRTTVDQGGPASQTSAQFAHAAGTASVEDSEKQAEALVPWFNSHYELYGRHVVIQRYNGQGNSIDEAQDKGQEAACADATTAAQTMHAFGDVALGFYEEGAPFADCAARQGLYVPFAASNYPERDYKAWDPYVWDATSMECERIAHDAAEYYGKRLLNHPARFAGDAVTRASARKLGVFVPNNGAYQDCVNLFAAQLKSSFGGSVASRYNYALDVSQFATEANRAALQFKAAGVTTVILACDSISATFLTQAAANQGWHPEWLLIGVGGTDDDGNARLYDQSEVAGHLFGMSELGDAFALQDPKGEAARTWLDATGKPMPPGGDQTYYRLADLFTHLQAAGPLLTPTHLAAGSHALPAEGGPTAAFGTWSWATSHVPIIDSREVYWDPNAAGVNGAKGHFVATYGGRRFESGQWPAQPPPIYPSG